MCPQARPRCRSCCSPRPAPEPGVGVSSRELSAWASIGLRLRAEAADAGHRGRVAAVGAGLALLADLRALAARRDTGVATHAVGLTEAGAALEALVAGVALLLAGLERPVAAHVGGREVL